MKPTAARSDQRRSGETILFRPEQRCDHHIAAGLHLAVGLNDDPAAQIIEHQDLMRFRQAEFPWNTGVLQARQR